MKTLLMRFEKDILHYALVESIEKIEASKINISKITFNSSEWEGKKYHDIMIELRKIIWDFQPESIIYHAAASFMWKITQ